MGCRVWLGVSGPGFVFYTFGFRFAVGYVEWAFLGRVGICIVFVRFTAAGPQVRFLKDGAGKRKVDFIISCQA